MLYTEKVRGDAMKRKMVHVTQEHIDNGYAYDDRECPIAHACSDVGLNRPSVDWTYVMYRECDCRTCFCKRHKAYLPRSAQRFIKRFDTGKPVKPFNFFLKVYV